MDLIVRSGAREEKVKVRREEDDVYAVTIGDRTYRVDAATARAGLQSLRSLRIDGAQHEVAVRHQGEGVYRVSTAQGSGAVEVSDPLTALATQTRGGKGGRRRQTVKAYMPGRVVTLLVEEGQEVAAGQGVLVLEAMKMENEIRAEHDGTVTKIHVQPGQAVDNGNPLFELE
ncbi:MAG TPA: biotin/lipoyl-containing protein [Thermoanaerobaculia bacterium]|jgi:pyruvate carboxylase subunit B|nr:biotin/lipoyl-containing protein [Thermoanaerobaculia bacterium]